MSGLLKKHRGEGERDQKFHVNPKCVDLQAATGAIEESTFLGYI